MKRCIICGNVDDDSCTVCSTCGNPYVDMSERVSDVDEENTEAGTPQAEVQTELPQAAEAEAEAPQAAEAEAEAPRAAEAEAEAPQTAEAQKEMPQAEEMQAEASQTAETTRPRTLGLVGQSSNPAPAGSRPVRRMRSGPQIYGQEELMNGNPELYTNQGAVRRDVPPRSAGQTPGGAGRPMNQAPGGAGRPAGRVPGGAVRPMGQMPGGAGRPAGQDFLSRRVMEIARKMLRSPLFFLIALLNTACVAGSIAAIFLHELNYSQIVRLINDMSLPNQVSGYADTVTKLLQQLDSGMIIPNIALHIPSILFCLGLWLIFFTALAARERMSGVGFGFAKAAIIIRMVVAGITMLAVLIIMVTLVIAAWVSGETSIIVASAIVLVLTIVVVMMIIMYYFAFLGTLKTCRVNGDTGESYGKLSRYVAVLHIILALPGIVGVLSGIVNMEISGIVSSAAGIGWMILFAVWIFLYRGKMNELEG